MNPFESKPFHLWRWLAFLLGFAQVGKVLVLALAGVGITPLLILMIPLDLILYTGVVLVPLQVVAAVRVTRMCRQATQPKHLVTILWGVTVLEGLAILAFLTIAYLGLQNVA